VSKKYNAVKNADSNASQTFLKGAAVMTMSMVIVKVLGFVDKIMISNLYAYFGDSYAAIGTGLYSNAYEIYIPLFTIATAGFPIAVSRLVSESISQKRYNDVRQIHKVSIPFFSITGTVCFLIMFCSSFMYIHVINSPYSLYAMLMLSPAILFGCLVSIYRGYFEGQRNMFPTAISEVIEAGSKLIFGLGIAYVIMKIGSDGYKATGTVFGLTFSGKNAELDAMYTIMSFSVAGAISGIVLGSIACFLFLFLRYKIGGDGIPEEYYEQSVEARSKKETFIRMFKTAIPIGLTALVMNIGTLIDAAVIQNVLHSLAITNGKDIVNQYKDMGVNLANQISKNHSKITLHTALWGCYGAALPLMQLVTAVTQAFGTAAMPNVASAWTKGNKPELKTSIETVLRLTMLFTLPTGLGLTVLARPIMDIVYASQTQVIIGAQVLKVMGFTAIVIACVVPICSMLQGIGRVDLPLKIYTAGIIIKVATTWLFVRVVPINIQGGSVGSLIAYSVMLTVGMYLLVKHSGVMPNFVSTIIKPLISAIACAAAAYFGYMLFSKWLPLIPAALVTIVIAAVVYITILLLLKTFTRNELKFLPKGEKVVTILEKYHLIG
jgi:stage V sporulation protein B